MWHRVEWAPSIRGATADPDRRGPLLPAVEPGTGSSAQVPGAGWHRAQLLLLHGVKLGRYWLLAGA